MKTTTRKILGELNAACNTNTNSFEEIIQCFSDDTNEGIEMMLEFLIDDKILTY